MARTMKDRLGTTWAILPGGKVCTLRSDDGPDKWVENMTYQTLSEFIQWPKKLDSSNMDTWLSWTRKLMAINRETLQGVM